MEPLYRERWLPDSEIFPVAPNVERRGLNAD